MFSPGRTLALGAAIFVANAGCVMVVPNDHLEIDRRELQRLAHTAPETRGQGVRVKQSVGVAAAGFEGGPGGIGFEGLAIIGVFVLVTLALSAATAEASRWRGEMTLPADQRLQLHVLREKRIRRLSELSPEDVRLAGKATLLDLTMPKQEATPIEPHAPSAPDKPLDRTGLAFKLSHTMTWSGYEGRTGYGFGYKLELGYFFNRHLGAFATYNGVSALDRSGTSFERAFGLNLQAFPFQSKHFHLGFSLGGGRYDGADRSALSWGPGLLLEWVITPRVALALRGDWIFQPVIDPKQSSGVVTIGLAIY